LRFIGSLLQELGGEVGEAPGLAVAARGAVAGQLDGALDDPLLLGGHDKGQDAGQDLFVLLGLLFEEGGDLVGGELEEGVEFLELLVGLRQQAGEVVQAHGAQELVDELGAADRDVLPLQPVQGGEQKLGLPVVHLPDVAAGFGVAEVAQHGDAVVTVEYLELPRLIGVGTDYQVRVTARPLDVGFELGLQILRHHVAVQRMREQILKRHHAWPDAPSGRR
jgi:hypothetical protein